MWTKEQLEAIEQLEAEREMLERERNKEIYYE